MLARINLPEGLLELPPATFSGGEKQRVNIARGFITDHAVLLLDEPIASLDTSSARRVMDVLAEINREDEITAVVSLHQVEYARLYCPRTVALRDGRVVFDGPSEALTREFLTEFYGAHSEQLVLPVSLPVTAPAGQPAPRNGRRGSPRSPPPDEQSQFHAAAGATHERPSQDRRRPLRDARPFRPALAQDGGEPLGFGIISAESQSRRPERRRQGHLDLTRRGSLATTSGFFFPRRTVTRQALPDAEDHDSLTPACFEAAEADGAFCLVWQAHGLRYGLPAEIVRRLGRGEAVVANLSRRVLPEAERRFGRLHVIEVTAPRGLLVPRIAARGRETAEEIELRLRREMPLDLRARPPPCTASAMVAPSTWR